MTTEMISINASRYIDEDDCLTAAADDYVAEHPDLEGWDLDPRWADDRRDVILLSVPTTDVEE